MHTPGTVRLYQGKILSALQRQIQREPGNTFTVMLPRQAGKNEVSAMLVAGLLARNSTLGGSIVVCAPTLHPQAAISFARTQSILRSQRRISRPAVRTEGATIHCGLASATFLSGVPGANVAGHSASILLIGDEAQDIDEDWFNRQFKPMTASTGASTVLFGTPWQGDSLLEKAVERNRARDAAFAGVDHKYRGGWDPWHHQFSCEEVGDEHYQRFVEQERERLGANHPIFLSQYGLVSVADERRLLSPSLLWALEGAHSALERPLPGERYVGGLDFAGDGGQGDATVLTIGRMVDGACEAVHIQSWLGAPFDAVTSAVIAAARQWKLSRLVCDGTGLGAPLTATLKRALGSVVESFAFTHASKSALGFDLIAAAETSALRIAPPVGPAFQSLWDELRICRMEHDGGGTIRWEAPPGAHDDYVVSLALCLRAATLSGPPRVALGRSRDS